MGSRRSEDSRSKREARRASASSGQQSTWRKFRNPMPPLTILTDAELALIDDTALRILDELGLEFQSAEALDLLEDNGAAVDRATSMVRMPPGLVRELVAKAPAEFELHARNPERSVTMGGNWVNFAPVAGPPYVSDLERGR
ncbi:MAG TPA: trimethylamine methyltransferase family protein, partial [Aestuariivirga sp.]|nr:trimethylamine methyltransferase family protein [Aestuariivirga sp.]